MEEFEVTCHVTKGQREVARGEDCYTYYPKPNYDERIVRCRACKHFNYIDKVCDRFGEYPSTVGVWFAVNHNGFCAWGEAK